MRRFGATLALALLTVTPAVAQGPAGGGPPGGGGRGGGDEPGGYASPSAIPDGVDERFGIPRQGRRSLDPIMLPDGTGRLLDGGSLPPNLPAFVPQLLPSPQIGLPQGALTLNARLDEDGENIPDGIVWRIFSPELNRDGQLQLLGVSKGGGAVFDVPPGSYFLHVGYGRAGVTKRIDFDGRPTQEVVVLDAGGLRLNASANVGEGSKIRSDKLTFDIYSEESPGSQRALVAEKVPADTVVRLNSGTYHVVSNYGSVNAVVRADVRVEPNRITEATMHHRAAELTMKLVREEGGEAIADTAWSISSLQGDIVRESVGAFSSVVLAEGEYVVVARNRERLYQRELVVEAGHDAEVELLVSEAGSGD